MYAIFKVFLVFVSNNYCLDSAYSLIAISHFAFLYVSFLDFQNVLAYSFIVSKTFWIILPVKNGLI